MCATLKLFHFVPDNVFVVSAVDEGVDFAVVVVAEENPPFDTFAKKEIGSFGEQLFLLAFAFNE
jgi:hypothetical protein